MHVEECQECSRFVKGGSIEEGVCGHGFIAFSLDQPDHGSYFPVGMPQQQPPFEIRLLRPR